MPAIIVPGKLGLSHVKVQVLRGSEDAKAVGVGSAVGVVSVFPASDFADSAAIFFEAAAFFAVVAPFFRARTGAPFAADFSASGAIGLLSPKLVTIGVPLPITIM